MARHRGLDLGSSRGPRDHRDRAPARSRSGPCAAAGRRPGGSGPGCCCWIPWCGFTASTRTTPAKWPSYWRTFARCSGSSTCRCCWCITRARTPRGEPPRARDCVARVTSTPSATRTCISDEPGNTWCSPASTARRRRRRRCHLELVATDAQTTHLEVIGELRDGSTKLTMDGKRRGLEERVLDLLGQGVTVTRAKLRDSLGVKNERLGEVLESLERAGRLCRTPAGWQRLIDRRRRAVPVPHRDERERNGLPSPSHRVIECGSTSSPPEEQPCQASTSTEFAPRSRWSRS